MAAFLQQIDGYKTYIALATGALVIVVNHFSPVPGVNLDPNNWINELYSLLVIATGRSAISKLQ